MGHQARSGSRRIRTVAHIHRRFWLLCHESDARNEQADRRIGTHTRVYPNRRSFRTQMLDGDLHVVQSQPCQTCSKPGCECDHILLLVVVYKVSMDGVTLYGRLVKASVDVPLRMRTDHDPCGRAELGDWRQAQTEDHFRWGISTNLRSWGQPCIEHATTTL